MKLETAILESCSLPARCFVPTTQAAQLSSYVQRREETPGRAKGSSLKIKDSRAKSQTNKSEILRELQWEPDYNLMTRNCPVLTVHDIISSRIKQEQGLK